jgi:hypothetical protein
MLLIDNQYFNEPFRLVVKYKTINIFDLENTLGSFL